MLLTRSGVQAFQKTQDDLIIKHSSDLLDKSHAWNRKKMKAVVKKDDSQKMDASQKEFTKAQRDLLDVGVTPAEAIVMTSQNKIHRVVDQCRRSINVPITTEDELDQVLLLKKGGRQ